MEVSPIISSRYLLTSHTSSGSFPPSEVTFHVPRASLSIRRSGHEGASRLLFGLGPAGSREEQSSHQALSDESRPQAWLQGGTPVPPYRATSHASIFLVFCGPARGSRKEGRSHCQVRHIVTSEGQKH
ncbi:hypothetical protein AMECASPLE_038866 [Ameca splendens]|uniref:Uncharacterized protein n=1 Tax=Ameca splendens TaxID=208324 RepID=A0ABV0Z668_9TELE